jgi:leucyl aminopeptidase
MRILPIVLLFISQFALAEKVFITVPSNHAHLFNQLPLIQENNTQTFRIEENELQHISRYLHFLNKGCGGFVVSDRLPAPGREKNSGQIPSVINNYNLERSALVKPMLTQVSEEKIYNFIKTFSSYHTRYYTSKSGIKAMYDLKKTWQQIVKNRNDIQVKTYRHRRWKQPSVILTIKGLTDENIIIGGHGDSINTDEEGPFSPSPGADDNASGIAVITEVIRLLVENDYKPTHNLIFMAYAAEEVGLRGSMDISGRYYDQRKKVKGVLQFDGTNYSGSRIKFALINDYTNKQQNHFLGKLIDRYIKVPWGYDTCHYACSDHYSWHYRGFTASFPAASKIAEENPHIHTPNDNLEVFGGSAAHAALYTKLGLAYVIELDK